MVMQSTIEYRSENSSYTWFILVPFRQTRNEINVTMPYKQEYNLEEGEGVKT